MPPIEKPQLVQFLESLNLHDRQSALDMLLEYPKMADMVTKLYVMKKSGADPVEVEKFKKECLEKINELN